ncbi:Peptidyl-prolyl cis-trans isomerase-like 2 [Apostasia shenzhenica]|uniref:Peptidyl-prolyl cis-trans isomerase-like 2 n=1 Tax=Apostasia shenzhenica TaxID=1088818 RepID=A0A2I0AP22_9ASPA|nr:Peptidyl-prolyl cis-trans isomerase-like 2 [Apostasia shenzhenica]
MSSVYVLEPPTKGKVVVSTTMGPLDIELWPKEAPRAVRNFVQLCIEGYYDGTIFHRIIKSFLVQGGDPTGTGTGGESIYGETFPDEFHSRLRFNHRGLVACANAGSPHSNGSQFFITLDRCDWLDRKNTIFGKVTGDSIFNLLRLGEVDTGKDDRPTYPVPKILSVEVLWNPFDDIVLRQMPEKLLPQAKSDDAKKEQTMRAIKKLNVLSFGEEVEEDEKELENMKDKIKSIHDVLDDPRFLKGQQTKDNLVNLKEAEKNKEIQRSVRDALNSKRNDSNNDQKFDRPDAFDYSDDDDDEAKFDARMRSQILKKRREQGDTHSHENQLATSGTEVFYIIDEIISFSSGKEEDGVEDQKSKVEKLSMKKKGTGSEARAEEMAKADSDLQLLSHAEQERQIKKQKKRRLQGREEETLARLEKFTKSMFNTLSTSTSKASKDNGAEDESGWMTNQLTFVPEPVEKNTMARKDDPNEYVVVDPLLEKGKEKFNRMQAKLKRREREWAGKSLT